MGTKLGVASFPTGIEMRTDYVDARVLAANVAKQHTVPPGMTFVKFIAEMPFYAAFGDNPTAVIPATDVTDGTASSPYPTWVAITGVAKISLISRTAGVVTMAFYSVWP